MNRYLLLVAICTTIWSCQPEPDSAKLIDQFVVSTNYDQAAEFESYVTYAIPTDTIGFISNSSSDTIIVASESSFPRPVLENIKTNLDQRGYVQVPRNANPDLGVNVIVANDFNVFQQLIYADPYGYPGSFYGGYYGYNSWYYYPYVNTYAYNTGVLIIEIVDLKNRNQTNQVKVVWTAYMGDVYSTLDLRKQTEEAINQAFIQSPYIGK